MLDIFNIKPNVISKNIRSYSMLIYGKPKVGKTTFAVKNRDKTLLLATEIGYKGIPGVIADPINSWGEFLQVLNQLKADKAKEISAEKNGEKYETHFDTIVIDVVDILFDLCEKYVCSIKNVDEINQVPYGGGTKLVRKEFDEKLRSIVQMGYGLILISHITFVGTEDDKKYATCSLSKTPLNIVTRLVDIYGYAETEVAEDGTKYWLHVRATPEYDAGTRLTYLPATLPLDFDKISKEVAIAVDKENAADGLVTNDFLNKDVLEDAPEYDPTMDSINESIDKLMDTSENYADKINDIIHKYLGLDKKLSDATSVQIEQLALIDKDLQTLVESLDK